MKVEGIFVEVCGQKEVVVGGHGFATRMVDLPEMVTGSVVNSRKV
jgi:hypothetical protein